MDPEEQERLLKLQLLGQPNQAGTSALTTGMEGMNVSPYMFGAQQQAPQVTAQPSPTLGVAPAPIPDTAADVAPLETQRVSGFTPREFGTPTAQAGRGTTQVTSFGIEQGEGTGRGSGGSYAMTPVSRAPEITPSAQTMKEALGIPAASDMLPNVPTGAGTVLQGVAPLAGQAVMQGINDMQPQGVNDMQPQGAAPSVMGVEETRARLLREFGAPTISQILENPTLGLRTDRQGRMIPAGFTSRAEAYPEYEADAAEMQGRIDARPDFTESVSDRERRGGGLSQSQLRRYVKGKQKGASEREQAYSAGLDLQMAEDKTRKEAATAASLLQQKQAFDVAKMGLQSELDKPTELETETAKAKLKKLNKEIADKDVPNQNDIKTALEIVGATNLADISFDNDGNIVNKSGFGEKVYKPGSAPFIALSAALKTTGPGGGRVTGVSTTPPSKGGATILGTTN